MGVAKCLLERKKIGINDKENIFLVHILFYTNGSDSYGLQNRWSYSDEILCRMSLHKYVKASQILKRIATIEGAFYIRASVRIHGPYWKKRDKMSRGNSPN
jgi:uncharacterized membrane protein